MELTETYSEPKVKNIFISQNFMSSNDETDYIFSNPATAQEIFDGLSTSWDDCIPEQEALS